MSSFDADIEHCLKVLDRGGTILYPTDTIWGIGCDATNEEAVAKIFAIKGRDAEKSLIVLVAGDQDILKYVASPDPMVFGFIKAATVPTTIIYDGAIGFARNLVHSDGSVGLRVVQEKFCRHLLRRFRKPVVSTSANFSGSPSPEIFGDVHPDICAAVDYVVRYRQDDLNPGKSSSVVKWNKDGTATTIRK